MGPSGRSSSHISRPTRQIYTRLLCRPDGFEWLLKRPPSSFDQAAKYQGGPQPSNPPELSKAGDVFEISGRKVTITAERSHANPRGGCFRPTGLSSHIPCELIDGKWWVDPRPMIIGLKAEAKAKTASAPAVKR